MTHDPKTEAWTLFADSQQLTDTEQLALTEALEDSSAGRELAADQRLHRMLTGMHHIDETRDKFISQVEQACQEVSSTNAYASILEDAVCDSSNSSLPGNAHTAVSVLTTSRHSQRPMWMHPLVLTLSATTAMAAIVIFVTVVRLNSLTKDVTLLQAEVKRQQAELQLQVQPLPQPLEQAPIVVPSDQKHVEQAVEKNIALPVVNKTPVATLTRFDNAIWEEAPEGNDLAAGPLCLKNGEAELLMANGTRVELAGPTNVTLLNPGHLTLERGQLTALVPENDAGFRVSTPTARVVDLGRQFRVDVDNGGKTDVEVQDGELIVIPKGDAPEINRLHLASDKFTRASIQPPDGPDGQLLSSTITGPAGFQGQIQLGGSGIVLDDPDRFHHLRSSVLQRFVHEPDQAIQDWLQLAESFNSLTATVDGKDMNPDFFGPVEKFPAPAITNDMFVGKIIINGEQRTFHSAEEFEGFRRQMTQPFPNVLQGAGSETQFENDLKTNPFLPGE